MKTFIRLHFSLTLPLPPLFCQHQIYIFIFPFILSSLVFSLVRFRAIKRKAFLRTKYNLEWKCKKRRENVKREEAGINTRCCVYVENLTYFFLFSLLSLSVACRLHQASTIEIYYNSLTHFKLIIYTLFFNVHT